MVKYAKKTYVRKPKKVYKKTAKLSKTISKAIDVKIKKNIETKKAQFAYSTTVGSYQNLNLQIEPISPYVGSGNINIEQGVGDGMRVGNKIEIVKGVINVMGIGMPYDTVDNNLRKPVYIQCAIFYDKLLPTSLPDAGQVRANFFNYDNTTSAMVGSLVDSIKYINTDRYGVFRYWKEKIGFQSYNGVAGVISDNYFYGQNNDFKLLVQRKIDITKYLHKKVTFNDNNDTATTRALFLMYWAISADGTVLPADQFPVKMYTSGEISYKDA